MRSLRDLLINKREDKGLTVSQVAYETNISKKYIEALEDEDFSIFPAEAYLLGFLRNYAEFLGLDYEQVVSEYKNCLLRDEPTPLDELMGKKHTFKLKPWMIYLPIIVAILAFGVPRLVTVISTSIENRKERLRLAGEMQVKINNITEDFLDTKVKKGDSFIYKIGEDQVTFLIQEIEDDIILSQEYLGNETVVTLKLGTEVTREFSDSNKKYTITLFLKDIGGFSDNSAIMKTKVEIRETATFNNQSVGSFTSGSNLSEPEVLIVKKRTTEPYSLNVKFEGDILFRYQLLGEDIVESMYPQNSEFSLDVTKSLKIWTSNAGLTKLKINGETLVLGKTGEVHVFTLRWIYNKEKDEYRLEYATAY